MENHGNDLKVVEINRGAKIHMHPRLKGLTEKEKSALRHQARMEEFSRRRKWIFRIISSLFRWVIGMLMQLAEVLLKRIGGAKVSKIEISADEEDKKEFIGLPPEELERLMPEGEFDQPKLVKVEIAGYSYIVINRSLDMSNGNNFGDRKEPFHKPTKSGISEIYFLPMVINGKKVNVYFARGALFIPSIAEAEEKDHEVIERFFRINILIPDQTAAQDQLNREILSYERDGADHFIEAGLPTEKQGLLRKALNRLLIAQEMLTVERKKAIQNHEDKEAQDNIRDLQQQITVLNRSLPGIKKERMDLIRKSFREDGRRDLIQDAHIFRRMVSLQDSLKEKRGLLGNNSPFDKPFELLIDIMSRWLTFEDFFLGLDAQRLYHELGGVIKQIESALGFLKHSGIISGGNVSQELEEFSQELIKIIKEFQEIAQRYYIIGNTSAFYEVPDGAVRIPAECQFLHTDGFGRFFCYDRLNDQVAGRCCIDGADIIPKCRHHLFG